MIDPKQTTPKHQPTMNEKTETPEALAAILAEMRHRAENHRLDGWESVAEELEELCDRIDAAAARERVEIRRDAEIEWTRIGYDERKAEERRAPGNAAAMRKALERIVGWCEGCHADACEKVCRPELTSESIHAALAALAAPARNCDRFATEDEAREAYWAYREPLEFNDKPFVAITEWLFAPAEGGAK